MLGSRLTRWIQVLGLAACSSKSDPLQGAHPVDTTAGSTTSGTGTAGSGGNGGSAPEAGPKDAQVSDGSGGTRDVGSVIHDDSGGIPEPCINDRATFGSRMTAGGATAAAFADAYNAELDVLKGPGPMLIVLRGVNEPAPNVGVAAFGALAVSDAGAGVRFAETHAEVPFTMSAKRAIDIARADAGFVLKFSPPASVADLPVGSVELAGTLAPGCGELVLTKAKFLVPASAGGVAFHGSTVGALMGALTETYRGQPASAWALELTGTAMEVYAPGVLEDGGEAL